MAIVVGTNSGFVTVAPSADPSGAGTLLMDTRAYGFKDTLPAGNWVVTEIGWWASGATEEADYDVGIYSHDSGNDRPLTLLGSSTAAKGTGEGWKKITGLSILLSAGTYWIAAQLDDTATTTNTDATADAGEKIDWKNAQTGLPSSWSTSDDTGGYKLALYALYEKAASGNFFQLL